MVRSFLFGSYHRELVCFSSLYVRLRRKQNSRIEVGKAPGIWRMASKDIFHSFYQVICNLVKPLLWGLVLPVCAVGIL